MKTNTKQFIVKPNTYYKRVFPTTSALTFYKTDNKSVYITAMVYHDRMMYVYSPIKYISKLSTWNPRFNNSNITEISEGEYVLEMI